MRKSMPANLIWTKLMRAVVLVVLIANPMLSPAAVAQTGRAGGTSSTNAGGTWPAPVGHRQPRAQDVPQEKNLSNPNTPANREDAELDRKLKSICRGC
jgi:hypothetical protein